MIGALWRGAAALVLDHQKASMAEPELVRARYERRRLTGKTSRYDLTEPWVHLAAQEKERAIFDWIRTCDIAPLAERQLVEIGCGTGDDLLQFIRFGFAPDRLVGYELLADRASVARSRLPAATEIVCGDAADAELEEGTVDVVSHSTVFTSLLDKDFQQKLARQMWRLARPGGGVLWYDFVYDNPWNPDVRGVPLRRVKELFPGAGVRAWRLTLAPQIGRPVARLHPAAYSIANWLPFLRIARLCWIAKPEHAAAGPR